MTFGRRSVVIQALQVTRKRRFHAPRISDVDNHFLRRFAFGGVAARPSMGARPSTRGDDGRGLTDLVAEDEQAICS
jgi:hypothetical protein